MLNERNVCISIITLRPKAQIAELSKQMGLLQQGGGNTSIAGAARTDEIVIGGFRGKLKIGDITVCKRFLAGIEGSPKVLEDHIGNAPDVVPIKFDTVESARQYIENNKNAKHFEGFWCNTSQTPEEREHFKKKCPTTFQDKKSDLGSY